MALPYYLGALEVDESFSAHHADYRPYKILSSIDP